MIYNAWDVKDVIRSRYKVNEVSVDVEQFGEGYNTYVNIWYWNITGPIQVIGLTVGEEESLKKALARRDRITASIQKMALDKPYHPINIQHRGW